MVDRRYLERAGNVVLENAAALDRIKIWTAAATTGGNQFWAQLNHPGRQCSRLINSHPLSASDVQLKPGGVFARPRTMRTNEIQDVIQRFANTAKLAQKGGFTGVQIQGAGGCLVNQFLSPATNLRKDKWGGSLGNRSRLLLAITDAVREAVGPNFPVSVKLNAADVRKGGFTLTECIQIIAWLEERKIDVLEISGEIDEPLAFMNNNGQDIKNSAKKWETFNSETTEAIHKTANTPLMVTGGWLSLEAMNNALNNNQLQLIGMTDPFCVDPEFPTKMFTGVMQRPPLNEQRLALDKGFWGNACPPRLMRAINKQGRAGWYYRQIINLSRNKQPDFNISLFSAFISYILDEIRLALRRRSDS